MDAFSVFGKVSVIHLDFMYEYQLNRIVYEPSF